MTMPTIRLSRDRYWVGGAEAGSPNVEQLTSQTHHEKTQDLYEMPPELLARLAPGEVSEVFRGAAASDRYA